MLALCIAAVEFTRFLRSLRRLLPPLLRPLGRSAAFARHCFFILPPSSRLQEMVSGPRTDEAALAASEEMFAERGSCCIWVSWSGSQAWERIRPLATDGGRPSSTGRRWWSRGLKALMKVREWSEIVAGPRWKTFIRRFRRRPRYGGERSGGRFGYDPLSYARNFDDGQGGDSDGDIARRGFSARYATPPASAKSSMDLGGRDAPPFIVDDGGEGMRFA